MEILVIGENANLEETKEKFGDPHHYQLLSKRIEVSRFSRDSIVFDFFVGEDLSNLEIYREAALHSVFFDVSSMSLRLLSKAGLSTSAFGFCGLPTFLSRETLETSLMDGHQRLALEAVCAALGTKCQVVADQAGLVTPRVICMIINEAYRTCEEGIASRSDIDLAMRLGTNYPYGPFEWSKRIGLANVVRVLSAVRRETEDDRYQISPLLLKETGYS